MDVTTKESRLVDIYPDLAGKYAQRLHRKKEEIPFVRKYYTSEKSEVSKEKDHNRVITSYITTNTRDRDGEVLLPEGMRFENYEKSGKPVFWGHSYRDPKDVVGKNLWLKADKDGKGIIAKTAFRDTQFADEVYRLFTEDIAGQGPCLKGWSVGFVPLTWTDGDGTKDTPRRTYNEWELLEYSAVSIPANPDAVSLAFKSGVFKSPVLVKQFNLTEDTFESAPLPGDEAVAALEAAEAKAAEVAEVEGSEKAEPAEPDDHADIFERIALLEERMVDLKEGRVLSTANRALVKSTIDTLTELLDVLQKLYDATDPSPRVEDEKTAEPNEAIRVDEPTEKQTEAAPTESVDEVVQRVVRRELSDKKIREHTIIALKKLKGKVE